MLVTSAIIIPVVLTALYAMMFWRGTVHDLPVAVYDGDRTELSRQLIRMVDATPTARVAFHVQSIEEGHQTMLQGRSNALIIIPSAKLNEFTALKNGKALTTSIVTDENIVSEISVLTENMMKHGDNEVIKEIKEYQTMQDELKRQIEALKAEAIEYLESNEIDEYLCSEGKVTYKEVISSRFDSTSFKKDFGDIYAEYSRKTSSMRFTCN